MGCWLLFKAVIHVGEAAKLCCWTACSHDIDSLAKPCHALPLLAL